MPGFPVLFAKAQVHRVGDAILPSHPLSSPLLLPSKVRKSHLLYTSSCVVVRLSLGTCPTPAWALLTTHLFSAPMTSLLFFKTVFPHVGHYSE